MAEGKPLSLNERNERLLIGLSRSRSRPPDPNPRHHPEVRVGKVKLEGRRRLCKVSSYPAASEEDDGDGPGEEWVDSPPREKDGGESIRDILDDLSSRMETLSVEKPRPRPRPAALREPEPPVEFESASSSLSSLSPEEEGVNKRAETEKRVGLVKPLVYKEEEEEEEESVVLERNGGLQEVEGRAETKRWEEAKGKALKPLVYREEEEEEEDEECVVLGSDGENQEVKRGTHTRKDEEVKENLMKPLLHKEKDYVVLRGNRKFQQPKGKEGGHGSHGVWGNDSVEDLSDDDENDEGVPFTMAGTGICKSRTYTLPGKIATILYPHQQEGLKWLWVLHCGGKGGILGDDMGLGKTMQVSAFLAGLFHSHLIRRVLIVAPKTLIPHWIKELSVVGLTEKIRDYSGANAKIRQYELQYVLQEGGVLLTTYDIVRNNWKAIRGDSYTDGDGSEEDILWDYTVLDEGHIIKNPKTQRAQSLFKIPSGHRVIISGTPIQNNLKELWALFTFCCPEILGDKDMFKIRYEHPILHGNDKNASARDKQIGSSVAKELRERIKPYFLRRLKSEVFLEDDASKSAKLSKKNEIIVWLRLTSCQRQLYEAFLKSELVYSSIKGSPLAALTILKKICDHPLLLTKKAAEGVLEGMDTMLNHEELSMVEEMAMNLANRTQSDSVLQVDQDVSCKITFIMSLLKNLVEEGHIILVFSQTRKMLNLIQEEIISEGYKFLRIDGTTKVSEREKIVKDFQEGSGASIFLLTSQVGGLGLTLTKADRVIVVDPAWNPSTDNQSVDRAYRIGQKKDVLVYRLMTCGTVEEKIYKMQVFKGGLFRTATEQKEQTRYFSQKDIRELFSLPEQGFDVSLTQQQLHEEHDRQHIMDDALMKHIKFLQQQGIAGVSNHSLLFSKTDVVPLVRENNEVSSYKGQRIFRSSPTGSTLEPVVNGAEYALNPKDLKFTSRTCSARDSPSDGKDSPQDIEDRIKRLSQILANKSVVSKLSDSGEKMQKQISELKQQLSTIRGSTHANSSDRKGPEVNDIVDLTEKLQKKLSV